ncbi:pentatricopeptide repeat-containing protein [Tanacetum coccineum]
MRAADIGETMDNEDVVKKGIDEEAIAKQKTLDKGNGVMNSDQGKCVRKKRMARPRGNGISIRENDDTLCGSDNDSESETNQENEMYMSDESDSEKSLKLLDYLSEGESELGEKFVNVEQLKECLIYYALANGFSLWYDRYSKDKVIAKCGHRKEVIKDPSKGKQRAYKKFLTRDPTQASAHHVCPWRRAKSFALSEGESSLQDHYGLLRTYAKVLGFGFWHVIHADESKFVVRKSYDAFTVNKAANTCSCRMWQISSLPCYKNDPIPKTPKVKGKVGIPKKTMPTENTNLVDNEDLLRFVNNSISEFDKAPSKNYVVSNDGLRINLGRKWNKNKRGRKSTSTCFIKMRGGKSSRGRLIPAERLSRIER